MVRRPHLVSAVMLLESSEDIGDSDSVWFGADPRDINFGHALWTGQAVTTKVLCGLCNIELVLQYFLATIASAHMSVCAIYDVGKTTATEFLLFK